MHFICAGSIRTFAVSFNVSLLRFAILQHNSQNYIVLMTLTLVLVTSVLKMLHILWEKSYQLYFKIMFSICFDRNNLLSITPVSFTS